MNLPPGPELPKPDPDCSEKVSSVDRTIAKFKLATLRVGLNLWDIFRDVDEHRTHFISESKFLSVLMGPLQKIIGLESKELKELTEYLKVQDGRIAYTQLCKLVHETETPHVYTEEDRLREDSLKSNELTRSEEEKLLELLTKVTIVVPPHKMLLKPFFQDYELIRRGSGQVSKNTFARVLNFLGVQLKPEEFQILFKKYRYDAFTIKYNAFLKELDEVRAYLKEHEYTDRSGALREEKLGDVPVLPRPEIKQAPRGPEHGIMKVWGDNWLGQTLGVEAAVAFNKLKEHVKREKLRVSDYFKLYDKDNTGRVAKIVFEKCVYEWICVSETCFNNLYISPHEMELLHSVYADPFYNERVLWLVFMDDLERGVDEEELATWPRRGSTRMPANPFEVLYRPPTPPACQESTLAETLEHIRSSMEARPDSRRLLGIFSKYDRSNTNILDKKEFEWAFVDCGIYLNQSEKERLLENYTEEFGVNWRHFVDDMLAHEESIHVAKKRQELEIVKRQTEKQDKIMAEMNESNIVEVLAKIKRHVICKRVWIRDYLKEFDKHKKQLITRDEFIRGLDKCGLSLTNIEMDTLLQVFSLPSNPSLVEYKRFSRTVDEESLPPCHTRPPLKEVMAHEQAKEKISLPTHQFANFEERLVVANALDKLIKYISLANTNFFKSIDKTGDGTVNRLDFQRALYKLNCLHLLTNKELDTIVHCFGIRKELDVHLDYMSLLNALDIVYKTKKAAKNL